MEEKVLEVKYETEVGKNLMDFYLLHKAECDKMYEEAIDKNEFYFYEEIEDIQLRDQLFIKADVVILTANEFEKNSLHLNAMKARQQKIYHCSINSSNNPRRPLDINIYFFELGDFCILHMEGKQTGSYSMGGSADLVRYVLKSEYCYPSVVISFGICFGNDYSKNEIGDTIIADKIYPYFMSAKIDEKFFFVKDNNIFNVDSKLATRVQYLKGRRILSETNHIFYGNMVTGEAVISNALMKEIFIKAATNQPVLGGEMEGYGLFKECQGFDFLIPCMIIKSICDWGVYKNIHEDIKLKDKLQVYAANQAYKVLEILMKKDSGMFGLSIYRQIKQLIFKPEIWESGILSLQLLKNMLERKIDTPKKIEKFNAVCKVILQGLVQEKVINYSREGIYLVGEK